MREFEYDLTNHLRAGIQTSGTFSINKKEGLLKCENLILTFDDPPSLNNAPEFIDPSTIPSGVPFTWLGELVVTEGSVSVAYTVEQVIPFLDMFILIALDMTTGGYLNILYHADGLALREITQEVETTFSRGIAYKQSQAIMLIDRRIWWSKVMRFEFDEEGNESAYLMWPHRGRPTDLFQVGDTVVVIGEGGFVLMTPMSDAPFWRIQSKQIPINIAMPYGGLPEWIFFFDMAGNMWLFDKELKRVGHRSTFSGFNELKKVVACQEYDCFYATDFSTCYIITRGGVTTTTRMPLFIMGMQEDQLISKTVDLYESDMFDICTTLFDLSFRTRKHISGISVGYNSPYPVYASIGWRNDAKDVIRYSPEFQVNPQGYVALPCSGVELCVRLRGKRSKELELSSLSVYFKHEDKRWMRVRYDNRTYA